MNFFFENNRGQKPRDKRPKNYFWFLFSVVFLFSFIVYFSLFSNNASAAGTFSSKRLTISDSRKSESNVKYTFDWSGSTNNLKCIEILFCTAQWDPCVTPNGFDSTGTNEGTWSGLTASSWNLDNSTNGTLKLTNSGGENPTANVSLEFLGFTNPSNSGTYHARITTYSDDTCSTAVDWGPIPFAIVPGVSITVTIPSPPPPYTTVIFKGKTSPLAFVTILKNGSVTAAFQSSSSGNFQKTLSGLPPGNYTFGIFSEDREERTTPTLNFTVSLAAGTTTTISGIFLPPSISLTPSKVGRGEIINISGETFPQSQINIFISPGNITKKTTANSQGRWFYKLDTSPFEIGKYSVKAKAISPQGEQSQFSETLSFSVLEKKVPPSLPPPSIPPLIIPDVIVSSPSHSDPGKWYNNNNPIFNWEKEVTDFSYIFDQKPSTIPDDISEGDKTSISYKDVKDGIWHFHIKAKKDGKWGRTTHFSIKIDTVVPLDFTIFVKPAYKIPFLRFLLTIKRNPQVFFETTDESSGVDYYEVKTSDLSGWQKAKSPYRLPSLSMGRHSIFVRAFDKAGNFQEQSQEIFIISIWLIIIVIFLIIFLVFYLWKKYKKNKQKTKEE